jgi:hypothetical protein
MYKNEASSKQPPASGNGFDKIKSMYPYLIVPMFIIWKIGQGIFGSAQGGIESLSKTKYGNEYVAKQKPSQTTLREEQWCASSCETSWSCGVCRLAFASSKNWQRVESYRK